MSEINSLIKGYHAYHTIDYRRDEALLQSLAEKGQSPKAMVISCCDSRVEPSSILGTLPGDLFMVRNVANLVPPCAADDRHHGTSAALEYAITQLHIPNIIIMGHAMCGGIKALVDGILDDSNDSSFIANWIKIAKDAKEKASCCDKDGEELQRAVEQASILNSLENLMTFPFIQERVADGRVQLHGWYFDFSTGELFSYDKEKDAFINL
ncbi:carbonic anhydrase [Kiloniella majae]|uniref:carbonic anhydrase n=1 Tax=Kiloniella majae TaxID=1938558 RepID=UPI000A27891D|nr:carbonic anhydrase [Kiloniella majae]